MKTRPILFEAPMVRAILAGRKSVTRRLVKWPVLTHSDGAKQRLLHECDGVIINHMLAARERHPLRRPKSPHGVAGDELWVRETWGLVRPFDETDWMPRRAYARTDAGVACGGAWAPAYRADWGQVQDECVWRPSIHMPRWASRITLRVTDVRVERVQDITGEDAKAEGLTSASKDGGRTFKWGIPDADGLPGEDNDGWPWAEWSVVPVTAYRRLWDSINGAGAWDANPWVWRVAFERVTP